MNVVGLRILFRAAPVALALGSRDTAGKPYVNAIMAKGVGGSTAPVKVTFFKGSGVTIGGEADAQVVPGVWAKFPVSAGSQDDSERRRVPPRER